VDTYAKLASSIVRSTVWREPDHVRILWITILALKDRDGEVFGSVPGLADTARITEEQCLDALARLMSPDPKSRTKDFEGRRLEEVRGGWRVVNHELYRRLADAEERRDRDAERKRRERASEPVHDRPDPSTTVHNVRTSESEQIQSRSKSDPEINPEQEESPERDSLAKPAPKARAPKRATVMPENFTPDAGHAALAPWSSESTWPESSQSSQSTTAPEPPGSFDGTWRSGRGSGTRKRILGPATARQTGILT
jgi:hypothetical protein